MEKSLLQSLHAAYLSRTEALRTYQATLHTLTEQLEDLRISNAALKTQLDITSRTHAALLTEITTVGKGIPATIPSERLSSESEDDDSGWWSDSAEDAEDNRDTWVRPPSPSAPNTLMRRGSVAANWLRRTSKPSASSGEINLLRKENIRLRDEVNRLEKMLEGCTATLVVMS